MAWRRRLRSRARRRRVGPTPGPACAAPPQPAADADADAGVRGNCCRSCSACIPAIWHTLRTGRLVEGWSAGLPFAKGTSRVRRAYLCFVGLLVVLPMHARHAVELAGRRHTETAVPSRPKIQQMPTQPPEQLHTDRARYDPSSLLDGCLHMIES